MMAEKAITMVLVCRRGFCGILDRALRAEGVNDFQRGYLSMVCGSSLEARVRGNTEVLVISTDAERAEKFIAGLRACPIRVETADVFELYTVGKSSNEREQRP
jgi:hypothetical protein